MSRGSRCRDADLRCVAGGEHGPVQHGAVPDRGRGCRSPSRRTQSRQSCRPHSRDRSPSGCSKVIGSKRVLMKDTRPTLAAKRDKLRGSVTELPSNSALHRAGAAVETVTWSRADDGPLGDPPAQAFDSATRITTRVTPPGGPARGTPCGMDSIPGNGNGSARDDTKWAGRQHGRTGRRVQVSSSDGAAGGTAGR